VRLFEAKRRVPGRSWLFLLLIWTGARNVVRVVYALWRYEMRGRDRIPREGPVLYVANHQSHLDPPAVGLLVTDRPCAFLARKTLFDNKLFGLLLRTLGSVPLDRDRTGIGALRFALDELNAGRCVLLFPEGMRSADGALCRFRSGFLLLARRANATVVPVAVEGFFDVWPRSRSKPHLRGWSAGEVCEPFAPGELDALEPDEAVERVRRRIEEMRMSLREHLRKRSRGRVPAPGPGDRPYWERAGDKGEGTPAAPAP
jgi:1-acyl-sn-glycerol-3-phosphate acyltransferase